MHSISRKIFKI